MLQIETFQITRDGKKDLKFEGEILGMDRTKIKTGGTSMFVLYKTTKNKYVCQRTLISEYVEEDKNDAIACNTIDEVIEFFGLGKQAKYLYAEANIEVVEEI